MRSYDVAVATLALDAPRKWTDNLLSHYKIPFVISRRRGIGRRITHPALIRMALVRHIHIALGVGVADAVGMSLAMIAQENTAVLVKGHLRLTLDRAAFESALACRLHDALESAPARRRGRRSTAQKLSK